MSSTRAQRQKVYRQVAHLHSTCINQGFLSTLGESFLCLLYQAIDEAPTSVLLTQESDGAVVGFVAGAEGLGSVFRRLLCYLPHVTWALIPLVLSPRKLRKLLEILLHSCKAKPIENCPTSELLSIAVAPAQRGSGVAEQLYTALLVHFADQGKTDFRIVVGDTLSSAHRFYTKMGAVPIGRVEVHSSQGSVVYKQVC
jgi:ribosomal protein S18 acetylase RimI-like enzyme